MDAVPAPSQKYHKTVTINGETSRAYIDLGSSCNTIREIEAKRLQLPVDVSRRIVMNGYGNGRVVAMGIADFDLEIDGVRRHVEANVVPDGTQEIPILVGHPFTEQQDIRVVKDNVNLCFESTDLFIDDSNIRKVTLRPVRSTIVPSDHLGHIPVVSEEPFVGNIFIEASLRMQEGAEYSIPRTILTMGSKTSVLPIINLSGEDLLITDKQLIARAWPCKPEELSQENVMRVAIKDLPNLNPADIDVGPLEPADRQKLFELLDTYRDCFSENNSELGSAKSAEMEIRLNQDQPFTFRPYRMAASEQEVVKTIVDELIRDGIVRESNSAYSSPVLLVRKKNNERRLCIDYRKLNSQTVKDRYPLPRIDDQLDRLHGSYYFTSLDLRSGYYQIPMAEQSKHLTSFVTHSGQFEFNRMPFGLANAPSVFQRLMNKVLGPARDIAAVYLDDVLIHTSTVPKGFGNLERVLKLLRKEGLTLNVKKCSFLKPTVSYLGFQISQGKVQPGNDKTIAIDEFPTPKNVHHVRQFIGLTGYFRHFVKDYALLARPLTALMKKSVTWKWGTEEENGFRQLQKALVQ